MERRSSIQGNTKQICLVERSPVYWRVTFDHPSLNIFGPENIPQLNESVTALETDKSLKVVVFDSALEGFFLTHCDFLPKLKGSTRLPPGPRTAASTGHAGAHQSCARRVHRDDSRARDWCRERTCAGRRHDFLEAVRRDFGGMPFIAEDLGMIIPDVVALRDGFGLPGMRVMQFGFDGNPENPRLPHTWTNHMVSYTGTHDNNTTRGWFEALTDSQKELVRNYVGWSAEDRHGISAELMRWAWPSAAGLTINAAAGRAGPGSGSSHERTGPPGRQLAMALGRQRDIGAGVRLVG